MSITEALGGGEWPTLFEGLRDDPRLTGLVDAVCDALPPAIRPMAASVVTGALWVVCREAEHRGRRDGDDAVFDDTRPEDLDELASVPGFGRAMCGLGWAIEGPTSVTLPRLHRDLDDARRRWKEATDG